MIHYDAGAPINYFVLLDEDRVVLRFSVRVKFEACSLAGRIGDYVRFSGRPHSPLDQRRSFSGAARLELERLGAVGY